MRREADAGRKETRKKGRENGLYKKYKRGRQRMSLMIHENSVKGEIKLFFGIGGEIAQDVFEDFIKGIQELINKHGFEENEETLREEVIREIREKGKTP